MSFVVVYKVTLGCDGCFVKETFIRSTEAEILAAAEIRGWRLEADPITGKRRDLCLACLWRGIGRGMAP